MKLCSVFCTQFSCKFAVADLLIDLCCLCFFTLMCSLSAFPTYSSIRSPGSVVPQDVECDGFDLTYTRIAKAAASSSADNSGALNVEKKVDDAIESFLRSLSQIGPELMSGCLVLSFFERRASKQLFGLVSHEERLV